MRNGSRTSNSAIAGSGNVFADIGVPEPEEALLKSELARQIGEIIKHNKWTQAEAAVTMGIDQPKVSALLRGRLRDFSIDRLVRFLHRLNQDVQIVVTSKDSPQSAPSTKRKRARTLAAS